MGKRRRLPHATETLPDNPSHPCTRETSTRSDWFLLVAILTASILLRVAHWSLTTVEHFDEGVYASNLWFGEDNDFQYPQRHLYAPPFFPWLIEWSIILSGDISGQTALWPSLLAGIGTVGAVWWIGRNTAGVRSGHIAAVFAALSGTHVLLSRAALTDALLLFWFALALGFFERACRTLRWRDFMAFGLAVGLAWWTKYNGWLPLLVAFVSLVWGFVSDPIIRGKAGRLTAGWALAASIAFAVWSPYLLSLQSRGGYSAVAANHQKYIVGFGGWWSSLTRQLANLSFIGGWSNVDLFCLAGGAAGTAIIGLRQFQARRNPTQDDPASEANNKDFRGQRIVATWFCVLGAMTPLYTPYPRLLLPLLAASWIASGIFIDFLIRRLSANGNQTKVVAVSKQRWKTTAILSIGLLAGSALCSLWGRAWVNRRGFENVAVQIRQAISAADRGTNYIPGVVYVYGEPALLFQLRVAGVAPVLPIQTVELTPSTADGVPVPTYLALGPHALRDRAIQSAWPAVQQRYELIEQFTLTPSTLVLLDNYDPRELQGKLPTEEVRLYRIRQASPR